MDVEKYQPLTRFGNMAGRITINFLFAIGLWLGQTNIYLALVLIIIFCKFTQQWLRADDFQIIPHCHAVSDTYNN